MSHHVSTRCLIDPDFHKCVSIFDSFLAWLMFSSSAVCGHKWTKRKVRSKGSKDNHSPSPATITLTRCAVAYALEHSIMHFWRSPNTYGFTLSLFTILNSFFVPQAFTCHRAVQWPRRVPLHVKRLRSSKYFVACYRKNEKKFQREIF